MSLPQWNFASNFTWYIADQAYLQIIYFLTGLKEYTLKKRIEYYIVSAKCQVSWKGDSYCKGKSKEGGQRMGTHIVEIRLNRGDKEVICHHTSSATTHLQSTTLKKCYISFISFSKSKKLHMLIWPQLIDSSKKIGFQFRSYSKTQIHSYLKNQ